MLAVSIWSFLSGMEIVIAESVGKIITTYVSYTAISVVPLGWLVFVLAYTGREHWLSRRNIALLLLHPIFGDNRRVDKQPTQSLLGTNIS
jgi:hypothetical protein